MGLSFIDKMKRRLELAADTKNVRLSQTRDHLIWKETRVTDDDEEYDVVAHVFFLNDEYETVLEIYPAHFNSYPEDYDAEGTNGIAEFFEAVEGRD